MISILCMNIKSKRTGNRELHLKTLNKMLPCFAAFERHLYVKPAYLYFQPKCHIHKGTKTFLLMGYMYLEGQISYGVVCHLIFYRTMTRSLTAAGLILV